MLQASKIDASVTGMVKAFIRIGSIPPSVLRVRADETSCAINEDAPVGVLLKSEEGYVGRCAAVVEHVADHLRGFDVAVVGTGYSEDAGAVPRRDALEASGGHSPTGRPAGSVARWSNYPPQRVCAVK